MWLKLGEYTNIDEAAEIISALRKSGVKWEIKRCVSWEFEDRYFLKGKLSELKKYGYREVEEWISYIEVLERILKEANSFDELEERFFSEIDPDGYKLMKKLSQNLELSDDEFFEAAESALKCAMLASSLRSFLKLNGIVDNGKIVGTMPDDPELVIELESEAEGAERMYALFIDKRWDIYVDCMSLLEAKLDNLINMEEYIILDSVARLIASILAKIAEEKMCNVDELRDYSSGLIEGESINLDGDLLIECGEVFDEILKALEKNGWIKVRGKTVVWKRS